VLKTDHTVPKRLTECGELCLGAVDGCSADQKVELILCEKEPGDAYFELRLVAWADGIGWYRQQTIALPGELRALEGLVRRARGLISRSAPPHPLQGKVLAFPTDPRKRDGTTP
jgi:hypothetical protein